MSEQIVQTEKAEKKKRPSCHVCSSREDITLRIDPYLEDVKGVIKDEYFCPLCYRGALQDI